jgi:hypothetical protein
MAFAASFCCLINTDFLILVVASMPYFFFSA